MELVEQPGVLRQRVGEARAAGARVGLVPTMGALHAGHLSLIAKANAAADCVVVSVFVNPAQFGPDEDLDCYPRDLARDCELCRGEGVDVVYAPAAEDVYARDHSVYVEETVLSRVLCGRSRPGHFRGVTTVVAKLFNLVTPDLAVFGQKDAQQVRIIEQLVRDLDMPVEIVTSPTVREADGLAMSSRNRFLSADERRRALALPESLCLAERLHREGTRDAAAILRRMRAHLEQAAPTEIDYADVVDYDTLQPVARIEVKTLIAVAARFGATRLIDNVIVAEGSGAP